MKSKFQFVDPSIINPNVPPRIARLIIDVVSALPPDDWYVIVNTCLFGGFESHERHTPPNADEDGIYGGVYRSEYPPESGKVYQVIWLNPSGLLLEDDEYIKNVIAHELAHVFTRHPFREDRKGIHEDEADSIANKWLKRWKTSRWWIS